MEREVEDYTVVNELRAEDLSKQVHALIKQGWQPWGSISMMTSGSTRYYAQAMVKYKKLGTGKGQVSL